MYQKEKELRFLSLWRHFFPYNVELWFLFQINADVCIVSPDVQKTVRGGNPDGAFMYKSMFVS